MKPRTYIDQGATFAGDGEAYRLQLWRTWSGGGRRVLWIMLNPSTADAAVLDPTLRRCEDFSRAWGFDGFDVCNIFALRSTDPAALYRAVADAADPVGPRNDAIIECAAREADQVLVGWGTNGALLGRGEQVARALAAAGVALFALGVNADGSPKHPLYLPARSTRQAWAFSKGQA